jgi:hypothetical protein
MAGSGTDDCRRRIVMKRAGGWEWFRKSGIQFRLEIKLAFVFNELQGFLNEGVFRLGIGGLGLEARGWSAGGAAFGVSDRIRVPSWPQ